MTAALEELADFGEEMRTAFREYGAYVNQGRAFPDVRDGLKPVQRRVLHAMWESGVRSTNNRTKSARIVGNIMAYHPHGDSAIYGTMVNMAQAHSSLVPLVDPQGNWGGLGHEAAAMRYTEARMSAAGDALMGRLPSAASAVAEVSEDTVDLVPNYAGDQTEPTVLPALWPQFVVNGTSGIGIGVAARMPSHNLSEVMDLAVHMVDHPNPRTETVLRLLPGPDMPCDAEIHDTEGGGIASYLTTGDGNFVMVARSEVEEYPLEGKRGTGRRLVFTGLPYGVAPEHVVGGVQWMLENQQLPPGIEVRNETTAAIRVVVDVGARDHRDILQRLLWARNTTYLRSTFGVNYRGVVGGQVRSISVVEAVDHWLQHRRVVIQRRSRHRLGVARRRLHLVEGFLLAIPDIQNVVSAIRAAQDRAAAAQALISGWGLSQEQADAILDMTLSRITRLSADRYTEERDRLLADIAVYEELLHSEDALRRQLKEELRTVKADLGVPRRCGLHTQPLIVERPEEPAVVVPAVKCVIAVTGRGWLRRTQSARMQRDLDGGDRVVTLHHVTDQNRLEGFTNWGYHVRKEVAEIPLGARSFVKPDSLFSGQLDAGEQIVMAGPGAPHGANTDVVLVTSGGALRRIPWDTWRTNDPRKAYQMVRLEEGETVVRAFFLPPEHDVLVLSSYGQLLRIHPDNLRGQASRLVRPLEGLALSAPGSGDEVIWAGAATADHWLCYWTSEEQVGCFGVGSVEYTPRRHVGRQITRTENLLAGAMLWDGDRLRWSHGSFDAPREVDLREQSAGSNLSDRQLTLRAEGIRTATAVWSEGFAEQE